MRKKTAAPGRLELLREFVNTYDVEDDVEGLASATALGAWLHEHGLASAGVRASRADLTRAIELREALRSILLAHNGTPAAAPAAAVLDASALNSPDDRRSQHLVLNMVRSTARMIENANFLRQFERYLVLRTSSRR